MSTVPEREESGIACSEDGIIRQPPVYPWSLEGGSWRVGTRATLRAACRLRDFGGAPRVRRSPGSCSCLAVFRIPYVAGCRLQVFWLAEEMKELVEFRWLCRVLQLGAGLPGTVDTAVTDRSDGRVTAECWRLTMMSWPGCRGCDRGRGFGWVLRRWRDEDVDVDTDTDADACVQYRVSVSESVCMYDKVCACARVQVQSAVMTSARPKGGSSIKVDACVCCVCWQTLIQGCGGGGGPLVLLSHCVPKDNARK
jgi:hypothetical protein